MDDKKRLEFIRGLEKLKSSGIKAEDYTSPLEDDVMKVKGMTAEAPEKATKFSNMTKKIDTKGIAPIVSGEDFTKKIEALRAAKKAGGAVGKKVLGALPFVGAGIAALQGDPAMAAEELAEDVAGPVGTALRSEGAGMSPEDEKLMLAEIEARKNYDKSPASLDAERFRKMKKMMGIE